MTRLPSNMAVAASISLKVDHICIISIKFGGNWHFTGFLNMFFDNNFLFFVTVTATLDDSRRSSIKILKEDHICILLRTSPIKHGHHRNYE
jgi:hypothetical protein